MTTFSAQDVPPARSFEAVVFGPAYLDRVLRVDRPLVEGSSMGPLDRSQNATGRFAAGLGLELVDEAGHTLRIEPPGGWPGPDGRVVLEGTLPFGVDVRSLQGTSWCDDLGGMGAGFAAALGGTLVHALGPVSDPISRQVEGLLSRYGLAHRAVRVPGVPADWTLLVSSGEHGDKLAVGFRGCHAALGGAAFDPWLDAPCDLRVVAGLPNAPAARVLRAPGARCRLFAPSLRNMRDRSCPVSSFSGAVDVLCCNRLEWETLEDREEVGWRVSILVVSDGPAGCWARFTGPTGETGNLRLPAFPRARPPRDTNRAGEALAATLISGLLRAGWDPSGGVVEEALLRDALLRATAAAADARSRRIRVPRRGGHRASPPGRRGRLIAGRHRAAESRDLAPLAAADPDRYNAARDRGRRKAGRFRASNGGRPGG
ncbi:MAG: PfkB family carbohydrate kinase [Isosphaeraceae bacterium]